MEPRSTPLEPHHLPQCDDLWLGHEALSAGQRRLFRDVLGLLLAERRAQGTFITDGDVPLACGASVFLDDAWASRYSEAPAPALPLCLAEAFLSGHTPILDNRGLAAANAGAGAALAAWGQGYRRTRATEPCEPLILAALIREFLHAHQGYRITRIVNQVIGEPNIQVLLLAAPFSLRHRMEFVSEDGTRTPSALFDITRAEAGQHCSPLLPAFLYNPPRLFFTPAEKALLRAAMRGEPDLALAQRLGVQVSAVKARWARIYHRTARYMPDLVAPTPHAPRHSRGAQIRHRLLEFLRNNPSELTPYPASAPPSDALTRSAVRRTRA